jgi:hypothetical protein
VEPLPELGCQAEWQRGEVGLIGRGAVKADVVQGNVDLTTTANYGPGPNTLNPSSVQDVDLIGDTNGSNGVFGGLSQSFATIPGQQYRLTFDYSHNNGTFSPDYAVQVYLWEGTQAFTTGHLFR